MISRSAIASVLLAASACTTPSPPVVAQSPTATPQPTPSPSSPLVLPHAGARVTGGVAFYRLRIEFSTTSDWSILDLRDGANVLTVRVLDGEPGTANGAHGESEIVLSQPIANAYRLQRVAATVDVALSAAIAGRPLDLALRKGSLNGSTVRISRVSGADVTLLRQLNHATAFAGDPENRIAFSVPASALGTPSTLRVATTRTAKALWAFYYPWYRTPDWASPLLRDRPVQSYQSSDRDVIERHVEQARWAGIDGFISSWWGPRDYTDRNIATLFDVAAQHDFRVMPYFETLGDLAKPRGREQITEWLEYFITTYRNEPAMERLDGDPLIVVWASATVPRATWREIFADLRARGHPAAYLAMSADAADLDMFDGLHWYGGAGMPDLGDFFARAGRNVRNYPVLEDIPTAKLWAASIQPGFDDRLIPDRNGGSAQDRADGALYRATFEAAIASDPDWIFITSWNEWWEHTYVEPSEKYGERYLQLTREFAVRWKSS